MTPSTVAGLSDPLATFMEGKRGERQPIPLIATTVDVEICGGIVVVSTRRVFRNAEDQSIEAVLTLPVPVHATLFALEARIGERRLVAEARRRNVAREAYESALADGLVAVLHEEVLRGVHMLSVGPLAPGSEVEVTASWTASLTYIGGRGQIRIPMTVGEIYGSSPLPDSDDLLVGGGPGRADLVVRSTGGLVDLLGGILVDGRSPVPLDAPIDLIVEKTNPEALRGVAADGRELGLRIAPEPGGDGALSVALLLDRSGSMEETASGAFGNASKHQLAVAGLAAMAQRLSAADELDLWEFDTALDHVGTLRAETVGGDRRDIRDRFRALIARLGEPRGGTEIGQAIESTLRRTASRDLLLITDGKSHALDVQALAGLGHRISVVLVGEDSLEANVGHLAALTGGDLFVAIEADMIGALAAALASMRVTSQPAEEDSCGLRAVRRGARIEVAYGAPREVPESDPLARAVAALVAELRLGMLGEEEAAGLAEQEGLVTHLTSLVLVDHGGPVVDGIPLMRKVALPDPRTQWTDAAWPASHAAPVDRASQTSRKARVQKMCLDIQTLLESDPQSELSIKPFRHPTTSRKLRYFPDPRPIPRTGLTKEFFDWETLEKASGDFDWNAAANLLVVGISLFDPAGRCQDGPASRGPGRNHRGRCWDWPRPASARHRTPRRPGG